MKIECQKFLQRKKIKSICLLRNDVSALILTSKGIPITKGMPTSKIYHLPTYL